MHLVEGILLALIKLLLAELHALIPPQPGILPLNLRQPARLIRRIRSLVPPLRVAVNLRRILAGQRERIQRIIDTRGVERCALAAGRLVIQLRQVQPASLLLGLLGAGALGLGR